MDRIIRYLNFWRRFDWVLFGLFGLLVAGGLVNLWGGGEEMRVFFKKQFWFLAAGIMILGLMARLDYRVFRNHPAPALTIFLFSNILLLFSLSSGPIRGINAWITIGSFTLEPSELAKVSVIILLAKYFAQKHVEIYRVRHLIVSGLYVALPVFLVLRQPDLGSAFVFFVIWLTMLLSAGIKKKHLLIILILAAIGGTGSWFGFLEPYQKDRLVSFLNPYSDPQGGGYSLIQSRTAVGSGGWLGRGWGEGSQARFGFLPEAHTDFAFASLAEQFGLLGVGVWFTLLALLFWRVGKIGFEADNNFAKLFTLGLLSLIFTHFTVNVGMNLGLLPITGISLPFLSYGGSLLISLAVALGLSESIKVHSLS